MIDWGAEDYHPVVYLPDNYTILDLSKGVWKNPTTMFSIGKYDEYRPGLYNSEIFKGIRNVHVGIDIGGPVGTPCMAFMDGEISHFGYNPQPGDYGNVVITKHKIGNQYFWALYGHLDSNSIKNKTIGQKISTGEIIGRFGDENENGGWEPHLHFQLSIIEPQTHDLPGVVSLEDRDQALTYYPDPRLILGEIY
tara:strand:+ start:898 stop:1479 length:582 start_codon:yes stop_codon:yes gene_type:complete